jgi:hypothetical protein
MSRLGRDYFFSHALILSKNPHLCTVTEYVSRSHALRGNAYRNSVLNVEKLDSGIQ